MTYKVRIANAGDTSFLSKVIVEAEKSGTDKVGLSNLLNINLNELSEYIGKMLDEEIDGCEFSCSSFLIAEYQSVPVAAFGGWIEGENEDEQSSAILKSNLIGFTFPKINLQFLSQHQSMLKEIQIEREKHTLQLEYAFVEEEHRGKGLINLLIEELIKKALISNSQLSKAQVQVFSNNIAAIKVYERSGFNITREYKASNPNVLNFLPGNIKLLMEKKL